MNNLILLSILLLFFPLSAVAQNSESTIIPQPESINFLSGSFELNYKTKLFAMDNVGRKSAGLLNDLLMKNYGFKLEYVSDNKLITKNSIIFFPISNADKETSNEVYGLYIKSKGIQIIGNETGQFYALQTLMQILPIEFKGKAKLPAVKIFDKPRFKYRGMHLDVGRHFMPVEFVKKYIDLMAQYKFNQFQWHLTEDQGWRIEIKKYPRLTEIGSKRKESMLEKNFTPYKGDGVPVEGFYTQEQIKDVVAYAKARHINVIPEIELPGHSSAALAAYPNLGCKNNYDYKVQTTWGIFKEVYCPKEETFQFLEDVLSEVIDLFPDSPYIHIGGDEVLKDFWKDSPAVQELMAKEGLKDEHEVQSYFIRRMEKFINSKGKKIIGWDEILEGGVAPNAVIMSWRGEKGGIESAKAKHDVIMTPNTFLYFDYGQGDSKYEPINIGGYLPLEKVYSYNPQPAELTDDEKKYVLGAQANVWTEYMQTPEKVEYMVFPRILALSEIVWSPQETRNYADFTRRLAAQFQRLDKQNVNYRIPEPAGLKNLILTDEQDTAEISLSSLVPDSKIYYTTEATTDGSEPTDKSNLYTKPIKISLKPNENARLNVIVITKNGRKSAVYGMNIAHQPLQAVELNDKKTGLNYSFYKQDFSDVKDFDNATPTKTGETKTINLNQFKDETADKSNFGVMFDGYVYVPKDEIYEFKLIPKGIAFLTLDEKANIYADKETSAPVPMKAGYHKLRLKFLKRSDNFAINLSWGIKGQGLHQINGSELFH